MTHTTPRSRSRSLVRTVSVVLLLAFVASACASGGDGSRKMTAVFDDGTGLFPSSPVRVRGVDVGEITDIRTENGNVQVDFSLSNETPLPTDSMIVIIPLTLLGERYLQIIPGQSPVEFDPGDTVPLAQTGKPAELDELLQGLEDFVSAIDEERAAELLINLAEVLDGNGQKINDLIKNGAQTIDFLADESDDLNTIVSALATLNETVASRSGTIEELIRNYNSLTGVLIDNQDLINGTIDNLDRSLFELARLLIENEDELNVSVEALTQVARTLDRNHAAIGDLLKFTVDLFAAADLAYNRENNWLPLNNQASGPTFTDFIADRLANRFAGICRRLANSVAAPVPVALQLCADGDATIFDDLLEQLPGLVDELQNGGFSTADANDAATEATLLTGLAQIFNLLGDLDGQDIADLEALSASDDQALIDLLAQHAPEDVPAAVRALLDALADDPTVAGGPGRSSSPPPLPPAPVRRSLEEVTELLGDDS